MLIFKTKEEAKAHRQGQEFVIDIGGVFALMTETTFRAWKDWMENGDCQGCPFRYLACHDYCENYHKQKTKRIKASHARRETAWYRYSSYSRTQTINRNLRAHGKTFY